MNLFILNGTCGSGKSSVSQFLVDNHNFLCISCDKLIREEKNKNGIAPKYNSATIYTKYFDELLALPHNTNVIIDSIFTEADINHFIELLPSFSITLFHIILYPKYSIAYKRTQERTCFNNKTEEYWVKYFQNEMDILVKNHRNILVLDNSSLSINESVSAILDYIQK